MSDFPPQNDEVDDGEEMLPDDDTAVEYTDDVASSSAVDSLANEESPEFMVPPPPQEPLPLAPVREKERFASLDVVRGLAVFGILFVNIQDFAMVTGARYGYWISGGTDEINKLIWQFTFVLCDTKFIAIFTMLFGASIALYSDKRKETGRRVWGTYYSRMFALVFIAGLHTIFLWDGDILYDYAVFGLILYLAPRFPVVVLILVSGFCIWLNGIDMSVSVTRIRPGYEYYLVDIFQGSWQEQVDWRQANWRRDFVRIPMYFVFQAVGHMTLGMVLLRLKFLSGKWWWWTYWLVGIAGVALGLHLIHRASDFNFEFYDFSQGQDFYWGSLLLSFGYMGLAIAASRNLWWLWPIRALASAGRMALSNYLIQTLICTTVFYGYGFGMYDRMERTGQLKLVLGIIVFELIFSWAWLKFFRFGPMEWVWRTMTYRKLQPMRKRPESEIPVEPVPEFMDAPQAEAVPDYEYFPEPEREETKTGEEPEALPREDDDNLD